MMKKLISCVLTIVMLLHMVPLAASAEEVPHSFQDVRESDWYSSAVKYVWEQKLFSGTSSTTFSPEMNMKRGMFVTVLENLCQIDKSLYTTSYFRDVKTTQYYSPFVQWAAKYQIVPERINSNLALTGQLAAKKLPPFSTVLPK